MLIRCCTLQSFYSNPVLSSFKSNTMGTTCRAETAYYSGAHEFTSGFQCHSCCSIFSCMCMFCGSLFVLLSFFFCPLCCLSLFDFLIPDFLSYLQTLLIKKTYKGNCPQSLMTKQILPSYLGPSVYLLPTTFKLQNAFLKPRYFIQCEIF